MINSFYKYFPLSIFITIWISVVILVSQGWYNIKTVSPSTFLVLLIGLSAFVFGYLISVAFDHNFIPKINYSVEFNFPVISKIVFLLFIITIVGSFLIMNSIVSMVNEGLDAYIKAPIKIRLQYIEILANPLVAPPLPFKLGNYLINFSFINTILGGILLTTRKKIRFLGFLPILGSLISSLAVLGRFGFLNCIGFIFISFAACSFLYPVEQRKKLLKELFTFSLFLIVLVLGTFYSIMNIRIVTDVDVNEYFSRTLYFYFSAGPVALQDFLNSHYSLGYGESSLRSIVKWLVRIGIWEPESVTGSFDKFTRASPTMTVNTYTYMRSLIYDFGIVGLVLISFIWGISIKVALKKVYQKFSLMKLYICTTLIFASFMSFYSFYFEGLGSIIFWGMSLFIIDRNFPLYKLRN